MPKNVPPLVGKALAPKTRPRLAAKNQVASQPDFNLEMAKVYLKAHDLQFCGRT
jgi:hypothetical protein